MQRIRKLAKLVRGGGRKLDILSQGLQVLTKTRFELYLISRMIKDSHHKRNRESLEWLAESEFKGSVLQFNHRLQYDNELLDKSQNKLIEEMEDLSGIPLRRDKGQIEANRSWYSLGKTLPAGEDFFNMFLKGEQTEAKIKRVTYPMVRINWDAERLRSKRDDLLMKTESDQDKAAALSAFVFEVEAKIKSSSLVNSEVQSAIETDFKLGLLSKKEHAEALDWVKENKIQLQDLIMETYAMIREMKASNQAIELSPHLEEVIQRIKDSLKGDKESQLKEIQDILDKLSLAEIKTRMQGIQSRLEADEAVPLAVLIETRKKILDMLDRISVNNIEFHQRIREAFPDPKVYESKVLPLYQMEENLEQHLQQSELWIKSIYRQCNYTEVAPKVLEEALKVVIEHMLSDVRELKYQVIDAAELTQYYKAGLKCPGDEAVLRFDQLAQEIQAVPNAQHLLNALNGYEKDLKRKEVKEKQQFILENDEKLQKLLDQIRSELRERLESTKIDSRRLRFEIFGLSDYDADVLRKMLHSLNAASRKVSSNQVAEQLVESLQALESQVLEAQRVTKSKGEAEQRLAQLATKDQIPAQVINQLKKDLEYNFSNLDRLLEETAQGLKEIKMIQNRFGANNETDYLEITINIKDVEKLRSIYSFMDTVSLTDIKRFCMDYNMKTALMKRLFVMAKKKDISVPQEVGRLITNKVYKSFVDKRIISLPLKMAILLNQSPIFDAECNLLRSTLNFVAPDQIRKKTAYTGIMQLLSLIKTDDMGVQRKVKLLWGRVQTQLNNYEPQTHVKNFKNNLAAFMTDARDVLGDA